MTAAVFYAPLVCATVFAAVAAPIGRVAVPERAAGVLVAAALVVGLAADTALATLVGARLLDAAPLASVLGWRAERPHAIPVPVPISVGAALTLAAISAVAWRDWRQSCRTAQALQRVTHRLPAQELVVVRSVQGLAHALPGHSRSSGRILVSDDMLCALAADERRVLLAHERSHLSHRHDRYLRLVCIAARINPVLRPVVAATNLVVERWADEDAAQAVGCRQLAARALARAALVRDTPGSWRRGSFATHSVRTRIDGLLAAEPSRMAGAASLVPIVLAVVAATAAVTAGRDLSHLFDLLRGDG